jgi:hypothetical protein
MRRPACFNSRSLAGSAPVRKDYPLIVSISTEKARLLSASVRGAGGISRASSRASIDRGQRSIRVTGSRTSSKNGAMFCVLPDPFQEVPSGTSFDRPPRLLERSFGTRVGWTPTRAADGGTLFLVPRPARRRPATALPKMRCKDASVACCPADHPASISEHSTAPGAIAFIS